MANIDLADIDGENGFKIIGGASGDYAGRAVSTAGDLNGDGFADVMIGADHAGLAGPDSGAAYVVFGKADGFGALLKVGILDGTNGFQIAGTAAGDLTGFSVSSLGDVNGDGRDDMMIGARDASPNGAGSGSAYVVFGSASGFDATLDLDDLDGDNGFRINGAAAGDRVGRSVSAGGDINGDGIGDIIVGAPGNAGRTYVVFGKAGGPATLELSALNGNNGFAIVGETADDTAGFSISDAGDFNGDGFGDIIIGAPDSDSGGSDSGAVYVVAGSANGFGSGEIQLSALDGDNGFKITGRHEYDALGFAVASAGDVNNDGFTDLVMGAPYANPHGNDSGAVYVLYGRDGNFAPTMSISDIDGSNGFAVYGEHRGDQAGFSVAGLGDANGDARGDIILGAPGANAAYVIYTQQFMHIVELFNPGPYDKINGHHGRDLAGHAVGAAGDVNGDLRADLIVGAPGNGKAGAGYVLFSQAPTTAVFYNGTPRDDVLLGGLNDDELNGLGGNDTLYGLRFRDDLEGGEGDDVIYGGQSIDTLWGGTGDDIIHGGRDQDTMYGGLGHDILYGDGPLEDTFRFMTVADSDSSAWDKIVDADFTDDRIWPALTVVGRDHDVTGGLLRSDHFDEDMEAAITPRRLEGQRGTVFMPDEGDLGGHIFVIINWFSADGYQAGKDLVIELVNPKNLDLLDFQI